MYDVEILDKFKEIPVFSLSDANQIIKNKDYAKKFLRRMLKNKKIFKIKRDIYTLHKDPFLISPFLVKPSYISSVSALSYYKLITQIPNEVFCMTSKNSSTLKFIEQINFYHTNYFFGFNIEKNIPIAAPEKAIIDSFNIVPVSVFEEAFENINPEKMFELLKKIKKSSIVKRIGYLMEKYNHPAYSKLENFLNYKYLPLDPLLKSSGKKDKKWRLIINT